MIYISHRGNIIGKNPSKENHPDYINEALNCDYNVEVDIWYDGMEWWLGHDKPQYKIDESHLNNSKLWFHCKNLEALKEMRYAYLDIVHYYPFKPTNFFWHQNDDFTLTNQQWIWTYTGKELTPLSIAVLPDEVQYSINDLKLCYGICSDNIKKWKTWFK
jgi:hypothetical protein